MTTEHETEIKPENRDLGSFVNKFGEAISIVANLRIMSAPSPKVEDENPPDPINAF
jgi:hypothetical protein